MNYDDTFRRGRTFADFVEAARANDDMWDAMARRAPLHDESLLRITDVGGRWRLLVLAEDWCGDAVNTLPVIARLAEEAPNLDLRIVGREEIPGIMERHLTRGTRSIPVVVLLDEDGEERGWWGPRPRPLQARFEKNGWSLDKVERYFELRRWYARDRGVTTSEEIATLVWCAVAAGDEYRGVQPCEAARPA